MRTWYLVLVVVLAACPKAGGTYVQQDRVPGEADRGETNGRMFDFVSNKPDGDDWQIRIRDTSMWAAYADRQDELQLGTVNLTDQEADRVWELIDEIGIDERDKGKRDEDEGYVQLRLRERGGEEGHDLISIYISRATEDDAVLDLGAYLQDLIEKYHKREADF